MLRKDRTACQRCAAHGEKMKDRTAAEGEKHLTATISKARVVTKRLAAPADACLSSNAFADINEMHKVMRYHEI